MVETATQTGDKHLINLELQRVEGELFLFIKSSSEFEKWLQKNKKLIKSDDFCKTGQKFEFYEGRIETQNNYLDGALNHLFQNGMLNLSILRIKGVSQGVFIKVNQLIPLSNLDKVFKDFICIFRKHYQEYLTPFKIKCAITTEDIY